MILTLQTSMGHVHYRCVLQVATAEARNSLQNVDIAQRLIRAWLRQTTTVRSPRKRTPPNNSTPRTALRAASERGHWVDAIGGVWTIR